MQAVHHLSERFQLSCQNAGEQAKTLLASKKWYTVASATATVAMGATLISSPFTTFFIAASAFSSCIAISFTAQKFGSKATGFNRAWALTAIVVTSSALAVLATHGLVVTSWGLTALKVFDFHSAVRWGFLGSALIGFGGEAARRLYETGLKIYSDSEWQALENFLNDPISKQKLTFMQRLAFPLAILQPQFVIENARNFGSNISELAFSTHTAQEKEKSFEAQLLQFTTLSVYMSISVKNDLYNLLTISFRNLPKEFQNKHLAEVLRAGKNANLRIPFEVGTLKFEKKREIAVQIQGIADRFQVEFDALKAKVSTLKSQGDQFDEALLVQVSKEIQRLRNEITKYTTEISSYFDKSEIQSEAKNLFEISKLLTADDSDILITVTRLNSKLQARVEEEIDEEDATWNFFLADASQNWNNVLQNEFRVNNPNDLDAAMESIGVSPLKKLIDNVLKGDKSKLQDKEALWTTIKEYKANLISGMQAIPRESNGLKERMYIYLASTAANSTSKTVRIASLVSYRAVMIISTIAPIVTYPKLAAFGAASGILFYTIKPLNKYVSQSIIGLLIRYRYGEAFRIAARRPLLELATSGLPSEFNAFHAADIFGKFRIITLEYGLGLGVLNARLPRDVMGLTAGIGGIIQGFSLGREIVELSTRAFNSCKAKAWRRQLAAA